MKCYRLYATISACVLLICGSLGAEVPKLDDVRTTSYPDGKKLLAYPAVTGDVSAVAYSPDGMTYASGNESGRVSIWDAKSGAKLLELPHGGPVYGLTYTRDGRWLASCSGGGAVVWNLEEGRAIRRFPWQVDAVSDVAFSQDGKVLYSCAWRHWRSDPDVGRATVVAWDVESGKIIERYGEGRQAWELGMSPDGNRLLVASSSDVLLFDADTGQLIKSFDVAKYSVNDIAWGPKGKIALVGTNPGIVVLDMQALIISRAYDYQYKLDFNSHFHPDGSISSSSDDYEVSSHRLVDTPIDQLKEGFSIGSIEAVAFGPTGEWFATIDNENVMVRWDLKTGKKLSMCCGRKFGITKRSHFVTCIYLPESSVAISPDGMQVLTGCPYGSTPHIIKKVSGEKEPAYTSALIHWDTATGRPLHRPARAMHGGARNFVMTSDGGKLALACKNQVVVLSTDSDSPTFVPTKGDRIRDIAFMESTDPKGQPELLLAYNHGIYQWDGEETRHVADVIGVRWIGGGTMRFDQLNGGLYFTTPMLDGVKMMYTIGKQKLDWTYLPPGKRATDMEGRNGWSSNDLGPLIFARMSPDGKMVLVGSHPQGERVVRMSSEYIHGNCRLTLLDSRDGSILEEFSCENELVVDAVFSPNNRYLLVKWDSLRTEDYPRSWTTSLWSIEEKSELMRFEEEGWSCDPLFTPDSQRFLFGRDLRDTTTGEIIWKLGDAAEGPASDLFRRLVQEGFNKTLISPDGKILVTGHRHGRIAIWSTETGAPIAVMGFTLGENNWYVVAADGRYDGTAKALETLFIQSSSGCEALPVALPKFHEPGLAGRLLPFVGRVTESQ